MKLAALFSGGKDSCYAIFNAINDNHNIASLLTVKSSNRESYMYHLPNIDLTKYAAEAMEMPLVITETDKGKEEELDVLFDALAEMKKELGIEGVLSGAIASNYQRERVEKICSKLKLKSLSPLWGKNQEELLRAMLQHNFKIMVVGVAGKGLGEEWLGRIIDDAALDGLVKINKEIGINIAGEGGELETLVVDCPLFKKRIEVVNSRKKWKGASGELEIQSVELVEK